jgi:hypothetical protein
VVPSSRAKGVPARIELSAVRDGNDSFQIRPAARAMNDVLGELTDKPRKRVPIFRVQLYLNYCSCFGFAPAELQLESVGSLLRLIRRGR